MKTVSVTTGRTAPHLRLIAVLCALALMAQALVPAGFMLHHSTEGGLTVVLCPDQGPLPVVGHDPHNAHKDGHTDDQSPDTNGSDVDTDCGFAQAAGMLLPPTPVFVPARSDLQIDRIHQLTAALVAAEFRHRFQARGPPQLS